MARDSLDDPTYFAWIHFILVTLGSGDVLTAIGIFATIGHAQQSLGIDFPPPDILIFKVPTINARSARPITSGDISALDHEPINDPMKRRAFIGQRVFARWRNDRGGTDRTEAVRLISVWDSRNGVKRASPEVTGY